MTEFLVRNAKYIVHMRQRMHRDGKLGLCLGAGISTDFGIPSWKELVQRISEHPSVMGQELLNASESLTAQSQFLYQKYLQSVKRDEFEDEIVQKRKLGTEWLHIIHECLYRNATTSDVALKGHPYLWNLMPLIKHSSMTINYNFDDTVERMLYLQNTEANGNSDDKGFEVSWQPSNQFRRSKGVIYHPNGFLPLQRIDGFSESIIFMEQDFADQLVDVGSGHHTALLNHLSKNTIIFVGLSLNDANLKHLLRISAKSNPGNFHYHIHWCNDEKPSVSERSAISKANFSIYNLVTLFLSTSEIKELARMITADSEDFSRCCDAIPEGVNTKFLYYVTGPVGSGKSTTLEQIRSIGTFDEWVDRRNPLLGRPHVELTTGERAEIDNWINSQFRKKNRKIFKELEGISIVDRSPLDPLYFVGEKVKEAARATELMKHMVPPNGDVTSIAKGHLIIFRCDSRVLRLRLANRDKQYKEDQLVAHQETITAAWSGHIATVIDTTNMTSSQVVSRVLEVVLFDEYVPVDFHRICQERISKTQ